MSVQKYTSFSKSTLKIALDEGWKIGVKYSNLRNVKDFDEVDFIDIDWKKYNFDDHFKAVKKYKPKMTVAQDIVSISDLEKTLSQARLLREYAQNVIIVPKDPSLAECLPHLTSMGYMLGYSVPSSYGATGIDISHFTGRVHLLGGRPDVQRRLASSANVVSIDCNRYTLDAKYGDYFNGVRFVKHPEGGYENCLRSSLKNIHLLWQDYPVNIL